MKWKNWDIGYRSCISIVIACCSVLMWQGCGKESVNILDIPFEELESSYYVIANGAIEIPSDKYDNLIIQRSSNT